MPWPINNYCYSKGTNFHSAKNKCRRCYYAQGNYIKIIPYFIAIKL